MTYQTCQKENLQTFVVKFVKFHAIDFFLDDVQWSDRSVEVDSYQIKKLIENNQCYTTWEIANILKICRSSVENYLHQFGYVSYFDVWVLYKLSKKTPS